MFLILFQQNIFLTYESKPFSPLKENEVDEIKEYRLREIQMWETFREIFSYLMFLWILYVVSYSNLNLNTYKYQQNMKDMFVSKDLKFDFTSVRIYFFSSKIFQLNLENTF